MNLIRRYFAAAIFSAISAWWAPFSACATGADDPVLQSLIDQFNRQQATSPQEKIFLQTNKPFYLSGDTIWYKATVVKATTHAVSSRNSLLEVSLVNAKGQVLQSQKIKVKAGLAQSDIAIPADFKEGLLTLITTLSGSRNEPWTFRYAQSLPVYHPEELPKILKNRRQQKTANTGNAAIHFYPEGGHLVDGLASKVAFQVITPSGMSPHFTGQIMDEQGRTVGQFNPSSHGLGSFSWQPEAGKTYTCKATFADGSQATANLPRALPTGYVMQVNNSADSICQVTVRASNSLLAGPEKKLHLLVQARGKVYFAATYSLSARQPTQLTIPKAKIPEGVAQIALFDQDGKPAAARLIYVRHNRYLNIGLKTDKPEYAPREKVSVDITIQDAAGNPVSANLALAVTDIYSYPPPSQTILSYLLLDSELASPLSHSARYLSDHNQENAAALDNLLITQRWPYHPLDQGAEAAAHGKKHPEAGPLLLHGTVLAPDDQPMTDASVLLFIAGSGNIYTALTDQSGRFSTPLSDTEKGGYLVFRIFKNNKAVPGSLVLNQPNQANWTGISPAPVPVDTAYLQKAFDAYRIRKAYDPGPGNLEKKAAVRPAAFAPIAAAPSLSFQVGAYEHFPTLADLVNETIPAVSLKKGRKGPEMRLFSKQRQASFFNSPLFVIDGYPTFDNNAVLNLPTGILEKIEVYNTPEALQSFGMLGRDGVLAIYTRPGTFDGAAMVSNALSVIGVHAGRDFPAPLFPNDGQAPVPHFLPAPFWQGQVRTDARGKATITFQNGDDITRFRVMAEGISEGGTPGLGQAEYRVKAAE